MPGRMATPTRVDLYNHAYGNYADDVYRQVRVETYGEDFGQTSWVTTAESDRIPELLALTATTSVLEVGCGSGRYALQVAAKTGCRVLGVDINAAGVENANRLAAALKLESQVQFEQCDASQPLRFGDASFDAVFSNDALCHIRGRAALFGELHRVLKRGGQLLFSDALVIGGTISHEELAARSSIGYYLFSPPGENERLLQRAGFHLLSAADTTVSAASLSQRWHEARENRRDALLGIEGPDNFEGVQRFLQCVHTLTREWRLLRMLYVAQKQP
jgi:SAM-dependent methyltransferase